MHKIRTIDTLTIESSLLCHNFINTVYAWCGENLNEYLKTYQDVLQWCRKLDVLGESQLKALERLALSQPDRAEKTLAKIRSTRQLLYSLVSAIADGEESQFGSLMEKVNPLITMANSNFEIVYQNNTFQFLYIAEPGDLEAPLWPVLNSVRKMLLTEDACRIKKCPTCGWVFLDKTRNGGRKWCSAVECGTKDKMSRYNQKRKNPASALGEQLS